MINEDEWIPNTVRTLVVQFRSKKQSLLGEVRKNIIFYSLSHCFISKVTITLKSNRKPILQQSQSSNKSQKVDVENKEENKEPFTFTLSKEKVRLLMYELNTKYNCNYLFTNEDIIFAIIEAKGDIDKAYTILMN